MSEITLMKQLNETKYRESPGSSSYYRIVVGGCVFDIAHILPPARLLT